MSNVPKFASFRPKPKPTPETLIIHQTSSPKPERSWHHKREADAQSPPAKKLKLNDDGHSSKLYFSDRRGDPDILRYGTLNRSDVPVYRRFGYGYVLGLSLTQKIDRELSTYKKIYITPAQRPRQERLLTVKNVAKDDRRTLRFIKPSLKEVSGVDLDFIELGTNEKRKEDSDDDETLEATYRSIDGKPKPDQPNDPDTQYDLNAESIDVGSLITRKNSELVRKTRESPEDIQAWLTFIDHQESMLTIDQTSVEMNHATRQQLADTRIPIYEEALKKVPSHYHVQLYLGLFKEARRSWISTKFVSKLKDILQKYQNSIDLWLLYLDFLQGNLAAFKFETCRLAFVQCLSALHSESKATPETMLHVFIRVISMIHGAGYQELAIAIWQAVLETQLSPPRSGGFHSFEDFWESEAPRIGEDGAKGWKGASLDADGPLSTHSLQRKDSSDAVLDDFSKREAEAVQKLRYPGRTADDVAEDDAFHTVFYADIQEYLNFVPKSAPNALVLEAFLCFCGLPPLPVVAEHHRSWWNDPFLSYIGPPATQCLQSQSNANNDFDQKVRRFAQCTLQSSQVTSEQLFDQTFPLDGMRLDSKFVRRIIKHFVDSDQTNDILGEYLLAFESRHFHSDVVKTAKQLLKTNHLSKRLYHAYGLVELRRGNATKAAKVFNMALDLGGTDRYNSVANLTLVDSWVWEALHRGDTVEALWRIAISSSQSAIHRDEKRPPPQHTMDAARETISEACERALLRQDYHSAILGTSLLALLTYVPSCNIEVALTTHHNLSSYFLSHKLTLSPHAELHAQFITQLLQYNVTHASIVKPSLIRTALEPHIAAFPNNTILLSLYAANEARFAFDDRVRGIMQNSALTYGAEARTVAGWSFAIHFETLRGEIAGATEHSIRAMYKRATHAESSGAHSPALWSSYLNFEIAQLQLQRAKTTNAKPGKDGKKRGWESRIEEAEARVKDTFLAGLKALPWFKDFAMLAFTEKDVRDGLGEEGLRKVYGLMMEKEMRVYVEVEGM